MTKKRPPLVFPTEPPRQFLHWLAGDPLILAASDEQRLRYQYAQMLCAMRDALDDAKRGRK